MVPEVGILYASRIPSLFTFLEGLLIVLVHVWKWEAVPFKVSACEGSTGPCPFMRVHGGV